MTERPEPLDAWLAEWAAHTLPERFPDLDAWIPGPGPLGREYWEVMRLIWTGATWRPYLVPAGTSRRTGAGWSCAAP